MWIVVEGPTCSGKSTLYDALNKKLTREGTELETVHMERPKELTRRWALNEYVNNWVRHPLYDTSILADRWHFGEFTYAPIYRPGTNRDGYGLLGRAGWRWTELFLMSRGVVTVQCTAPIETLITRLDERGDDHVQNHDELRQVAALYWDAINESPTTTLTFDTTGESDLTARTNLVVRVAELNMAHVRELDVHPGYIGPRNPAVLLLGDERNITKEFGEETILPFMPVNGNSGDFLLNALPDEMWKLCGIVNASEQTDLEQLWHLLGRPHVAALGSRAAMVAERAGIPHTDFHHPQYVRRFAHGEQVEYGEAITRKVS